MAVSMLASSGYRVARSWQYEDGYPPDPPPRPVPLHRDDDDEMEPNGVGGCADGVGRQLLQNCVDRKASMEARRPLIDETRESAGKRMLGSSSGYGTKRAPK